MKWKSNCLPVVKGAMERTAFETALQEGLQGQRKQHWNPAQKSKVHQLLLQLLPTPSVAKELLEEGHTPLGAIPLPRPLAAEKKG